MKERLTAISAALILISLSACSAAPESSAQNSSEAPAVTAEAQTDLENRFMSYDFSAVSSPVKLNEDAVPVKELPGGYQWAEYNEPQSMQDIMKWVTQVGIITITGSERFEHFSGDPELDSAIAEKAGADLVGGTVFKAKVLYPLAGSLTEGETIKIYHPTGDWGVELIEGKDYLVTLAEWGDAYKLGCDMSSVFDIDDDFVVTSQSSFMAAAKFNGLSLADASYLLRQDFENALERDEVQ